LQDFSRNSSFQHDRLLGAHLMAAIATDAPGVIDHRSLFLHPDGSGRADGRAFAATNTPVTDNPGAKGVHSRKPEKGLEKSSFPDPSPFSQVG